MSDSEYEHINNAINGMIGQLSVPMMKFRDPEIKEVHTHLLELASWLDDNINEPVTCEHGNGPECLQCATDRQLDAGDYRDPEGANGGNRRREP